MTRRDQTDPLFSGLPPELEDDWIDAVAGQAPGEGLARWLDSHPEARAELESLGAIRGALEQDRDSQDPGAHFFDALHEDVMAGLREAPFPGEGVVELKGGEVSVAPTARRATSWLDGLRSIFVDRPTLSYGLGMGLALLGIIVMTWAGAEKLNQEQQSSDAGGVVAEADAEREGEPDARPERALPPHLAGLSDEERAELRAMADEIELDLGQEEGGDAFVEGWGSGVVGLAASAEEDDMEGFEEELERSL